MYLHSDALDTLQFAQVQITSHRGIQLIVATLYASANQRDTAMFKPLLTPVYLLLSLLYIATTAQAKDISPDYQFPLHNPFEATVAGTPSTLYPDLPDRKSVV